ncbi:MAG: SDR family NAD(P)-dependent oxidoreductase [Streptomycetaceae bacterium]|jgi:NAD(P)-dependent dehydrogenase (short-subunit alcohol dehydrogenase family)|nr:SDR family NAD(P)-dependent oxidoreductase [Streptomycetaceae bacterium]
MPSTTGFTGRTAAVTGAGGGLGRALAIGLARSGARLALADIDGAGLAGTERELARRCPGTNVRPTELDVRRRPAVEAWADDTARFFGSVDVLVNNAGVGLVAPVEDMDEDDFAWLMDVNVNGVVHGCRAFLPYLRQAPGSSLVNVASAFSRVGVPGLSAYCASKYAVEGFTEALRQEQRLARSGVHVMTVLPGGIRTGIAESARSSAAVDRDRLQAVGKLMMRHTPESAARTILRGIRQHRRRLYVGADAVALDVLRRVLGVGAEPFVRFGAGRLLPVRWK